ncbi:MAG: class I SAM-dependent methyltransferase [Devosia sp.]
MTATLYPADFYQNRRVHTAHAAQGLLAALPADLPRASIADIGCGTGTWLAAALASGSTTALGLEGDWVTASMLDDPRIALTQHDLEKPFTAPRVDLAISLEVAEHLSPARALGFVADLVALAPAVLFSAAIPGQGGVGHTNEQWQSWWAAHFASHGYTAHDVIRPAIWADDAIPAWYRQNAVLYLDAATRTRLGLAPSDPALLDSVHPAFWARANRELGYANALPESEVLRRQAQQAQQQ